MTVSPLRARRSANSVFSAWRESGRRFFSAHDVRHLFAEERVMSAAKVPSINYDRVIAALKRDGWVVVRQRGSHIRLQKHTRNETLKLTVPAHRPIKRTTLSHILKDARLTPDEFDSLL